MALNAGTRRIRCSWCGEQLVGASISVAQIMEQVKTLEIEKMSNKRVLGASQMFVGVKGSLGKTNDAPDYTGSRIRIMVGNRYVTLSLTLMAQRLTLIREVSLKTEPEVNQFPGSGSEAD